MTLPPLRAEHRSPQEAQILGLLGSKKGKLEKELFYKETMKMKHMKRFMALFAALALVLAMAVPAFADEPTTGSITISNAIPGTEYKAYKMFDLSYTSGDETKPASYSYKVVDKWADFFETGTGKTYIPVDDTTGYAGKPTFRADSTEAATFAKAALEYATTNGITATKTQIAGQADAGKDTATVKMDGLALGYYLVDTNAGALCSLGTTDYTAVIKEKNEVPSVVKQTKVDNEDWAKENYQQIGKVVEFKTTIHAKKGAQKYVLHDTMTDGLTFNGSVQVKVNNANLNADTDYTFTTNPGDGCAFHVALTDSYCNSITDDKDIEVYYSATVNKNAVKSNVETNETWLDYGEGHETTKDSTKTKIYQFDLVKYTKVDETKYLLDGAEFKLYEDQDKNTVVKFVYDNTTQTYRVADSSEAGDATIKVEGGKVTLTGLKKKTYYLEETQEPRGYNKLNGLQTVNLGESGFVPTASVNQTAKTYTDGGYGVENNAGTTLPTTGGIGTTIFYLIGGGLMVAAAVLLIAKKRMENK